MNSFQRTGSSSMALLLFMVLSMVLSGAHARVVWPPRKRTNPPNWKPKVDPATYNPKKADWSSVISACRAIMRKEKRIANFLIRSAFHDGMAVDVTACAMGNAASPTCGGADASLVLTVDELMRFENVNDNFSGIAGRVAIRIASWYDTSVADVMAVCGAVGIEMQSGRRVQIIGGKRGSGLKRNFKVGRLDSLTPSPPGQLPAATAQASDFKSFWSTHGFTMEEAMALMGSHALIDEQVCLRANDGDYKDYCDPFKEPCKDLRMFRWQNHYFHDLCSPSIAVEPLPAMEFPDGAVADMEQGEFESATMSETCKFTSDVFRALAQQNLLDERLGKRKEAAVVETVSISWENEGCEAGKAWGAQSCPHSGRWMYTVNDAYLAQTCQGISPEQPAVDDIKNAMRKFLDQQKWDDVIPDAMIKMVNRFALFTPNAIMIGGRECANQHAVDKTCAKERSVSPGSIKCNGCAVGDTDCDECCVCPGGFTKDGYAVKPGAIALNLPPPPIITPLGPIPRAPDGSDVVMIPDMDIPKNVRLPAPMDEIPISPYPNGACNGDGASVRGFPSSPFRFTPFTNTFSNPPVAQQAVPTRCHPVNGLCMDVYEIDVVEIEKDLGVGCTAAKTKLLSYAGSIPGPSIITPTGRQTLVRFNNKISDNSERYHPHPPCTTEKGRKGRPISIHLHGSASLAPYDGWAEDSTCSYETKDYVYPNNRATTGWYHDHQLDITADNAHAGLAGLYIIKTGTEFGNGEDRWGLDGMEELHMILADKVIDSQCQLRLETKRAHKNAHFGDINLVSGKPWPQLTAQPKWYRFRLLNAAITRPWLLNLVDKYGNDVSSAVCWMIAGDGGYRRTPIPFPSGGLFMGVAERYEIACDLSGYRGQRLYWWNTWDENRMKDVPFFCWSHLVMRVDVADKDPDCKTQTTTCPEFMASGTPIMTHVDHLYRSDEYTQAVARGRAFDCDRHFVFGRRHGQWVVNGDTWETYRIAARNVGANAQEIWCLETKGGWFHPIHIHLIDMFVLHRANSGSHPSLETFESEVPKDVVQLHPGGKVALMARFGPHRGEYMFHCHNLRHEDNEMMRSFDVSTYNETSTGSLSDLSFMEFTQIIGGQVYDNYRSPRYPDASAKDSSWVRSNRPLRVSGPTGDTYPYLDDVLGKELYRIFYPSKVPSDEHTQLCDRSVNPWLVHDCTT